MAKHFELAECKLLTKILIASDFSLDSICDLFISNYSTTELDFDWGGTRDYMYLRVATIDFNASSEQPTIIWEGSLPN